MKTLTLNVLQTGDNIIFLPIDGPTQPAKVLIATDVRNQKGDQAVLLKLEDSLQECFVRVVESDLAIVAREV